MGESPLERRARELRGEDDSRRRHPLIIEYMPRFVGLYVDFITFCINNVTPRHYLYLDGPAPAARMRRWRARQQQAARPTRPCWPLLAEVTDTWSSGYDDTSVPTAVRALTAVDTSTVAVGAFLSISDSKPPGSIERELPAEQALRWVFLPTLTRIANTEYHPQTYDYPSPHGNRAFFTNSEVIDSLFGQVERTIIRYVESRETPPITGINNPLNGSLPSTQPA